MPKGMLQALLNTTPNSQTWAPIDLSNCIFRNTEATDSIEDVVRAVGNLGTSEEHTLQDPKITPVDGSDPTRNYVAGYTNFPFHLLCDVTHLHT